jgi:hypothetical protein
MLASKGGCYSFAEEPGVTGHHLEELSRTGLRTIKMKRLETDASESIGRRKTHQSSDDSSIAMSPQHRALDMKCIEQIQSLHCGSFMEIGGEMVQALRTTISSAIGNDNSEAVAQRIDLSIERVNLVAPSSVQEHKRRS